mmetsp:Transcript_16314/g.42152  ORF Transcript_16314/g.42152 Transcript_16314/m.42152 type:complete len:334 (+) Transcript_16314:144-1145(+)
MMVATRLVLFAALLQLGSSIGLTRTLSNWLAALDDRAGLEPAGPKGPASYRQRSPFVELIHVSSSHVAATQGQGNERHGQAERAAARSAGGSNATASTAEAQGTSTRAGAAAWAVVVGLMIFVPILITAGCMSLSNQVNSPGMVAGSLAIVFGKISGSGRRPQTTRQDSAAEKGARAASTRKAQGGTPTEASGGKPSKDQPMYGGWRRPGPWGMWQDGKRPTSTADSRVPTSKMAGPDGVAEDSTQYRQWADPRYAYAAPTSATRAAPQDPGTKRVHFTTPTAQSLSGSAVRVEAKPQSAFPAAGATPSETPVYCEPKPQQEGAYQPEKRADY